MILYTFLFLFGLFLGIIGATLLFRIKYGDVLEYSQAREDGLIDRITELEKELETCQKVKSVLEEKFWEQLESKKDSIQDLCDTIAGVSFKESLDRLDKLAIELDLSDEKLQRMRDRNELT